MSGRRFLVLHGWENHRPVEHWQWWLVDRLRADGEQVLYPQLPTPDDPVLEEWLELLAAEWLQMGDGERVVVAHSLSCLLWLHAVSRGVLDRPADRVLLVAPPGPTVTEGIAEIERFVAPMDPEAVAAGSRTPVRLVASDADPYCTEGPAAKVYGEPLGLKAETVAGAGHFTIEDGYGPWPAVDAWCRDGAQPLRLGHREWGNSS